MITNNQLKYYSSLLKKKYRQAEKKFLVEGYKPVFEALNSNWKCEAVFVTSEFINANPDQFFKLEKSVENILKVNSQQFQRISDTKTPQGIIAVIFKDEKNISNLKNVNDKIIVYLDEISDPGNMGTILRNCDWFGITTVLLSKNCVETTNPKSVRSSIGSIFHLNIYEGVELNYLKELIKWHYKIFVTDIVGESIFDLEIPEYVIISFSNEAEGPSHNILNIADSKITIPKIGKAESLNVASASAIILAELTKKV